jgi:hypothetical protein
MEKGRLWYQAPASETRASTTMSSDNGCGGVVGDGSILSRCRPWTVSIGDGAGGIGAGVGSGGAEAGAGERAERPYPDEATNSSKAALSLLTS